MADDENPPAVPAGDTANIGGIESAFATVPPSRTVADTTINNAGGDVRPFATVPPSEITNSGNAMAIELIAGVHAILPPPGTNSVPPPPLPQIIGTPSDVLVRRLSPLRVPNTTQPFNSSIGPDDASHSNMDEVVNYDGSLDMLVDDDDKSESNSEQSIAAQSNTEESIAPKKKKRARIKFKDQGILGTSSMYMRGDADKDIQTEHRVANYVMKGVLVEIPTKKNNMSYKVVWDVLGCVAPIQAADLRTTFFKDDEMFEIMRKARVLYDESYNKTPTFHLKKPCKKSNKDSPSTPTPKKKKRKKKKSTKPESSKKKASRLRTGVRMMPVPTPTALLDDNNPDHVARMVSELDIEPESDDGSDLDDVDIEKECPADDAYDPKSMEEDGSYDIEHV